MDLEPALILVLTEPGACFGSAPMCSEPEPARSAASLPVSLNFLTSDPVRSVIRSSPVPGSSPTLRFAAGVGSGKSASKARSRAGSDWELWEEKLRFDRRKTATGNIKRLQLPVSFTIRGVNLTPLPVERDQMYDSEELSDLSEQGAEYQLIASPGHRA